MSAFFRELRQGRVYRLAASYAVAAWLILQLATLVREPLGLPLWTLKATIGVLLVGFSAALWVGWLQDHKAGSVDGPGQRRTRRHHFAFALVSLLPSALVALGFYLLHLRPPVSLEMPVPANVELSEKSIAVLPFESFSADQENAYFAEGIQDEILTDLAQVADLKVISRTSVQAYGAGTARNLREIGRTLGVAHLLEGSVQRAAGRVRITAQLIDARTDLHQWAERYDESLQDVFALQSKVSEQIVAQLKAKLSPGEKRAIDAPPTTDMAAYDAYLHARELLANFQSAPDWAEPHLHAIRLLDDARRRDPNFALADCLAAQAHGQLYWLGLDRTPARLALAEASVANALRLQPNLGEAHLARARLLYHERDFRGAMDELAVARRALPNSAEVFSMMSYVDRRQGRWPDAVRSQEKSLSLDPRNYTFLNDSIVLFDMLRAYHDEGRMIEKGLAALPQEGPYFQLMKAELQIEAGWTGAGRATLALLPPDYDPGGATTFTRLTLALYEHKFDEAARVLADSKSTSFTVANGAPCPRAWLEATVARAAGKPAQARAAAVTARNLVASDVRERPDDAGTLALLGLIDAQLGNKSDALRAGKRAVELRPTTLDAMDGPGLENTLALICAWTGERDEAITHLTAAVRVPGGPHYGELHLDPAWDVLRDDVRFTRLETSLLPNNG